MKNTTIIFLIILCQTAFAQKPSLSYYLPDIQYDQSVPAPESILGYMPGEMHITHDQILMYMREVAKSSDRVSINEYAKSYEGRPLILLTITSPKNHRNLENIRKQHLDLCDPNKSTAINVTGLPAVLYQAFSIHGSETSGANASPLMAYYLAAGQGSEIEQLLEEVIVLFDPCLNPDGLTRFANWMNMHKSRNPVSDYQVRGFHPAWPSGRTNHYWFDLNRDWFSTQHPESRGRIETFHQWRPNVLTDHHEMNGNKTFFFQPGVDTRIHPLTLPENQGLTHKMAAFHADALDNIGSLYYSAEGFDDYYYGKGSAYPDANGGVGILFEQAGARGLARATDNGLITFPFTIRNQVTASFSTLKAVQSLRKEFLEYQRYFYQSAAQEAKKDHTKAYVFQEKYDKNRLKRFIELLQRHQIEVHRLAKATTLEGIRFDPQNAFIVPLEQAQYRLLKSVFEKHTNFGDSIFYDVTTWTAPLAFNMEYAALEGNAYAQSFLGKKLDDTNDLIKTALPEKSGYGYLFGWDDYYAPKLLGALMEAGLWAKVSTKRFTLEGHRFNFGTILIPLQNQKKSPEEIFGLIQEQAAETGIRIHGVKTGLSPEGIDLGSPSFRTLQNPRIMLIVGDGISSNEAGEVWHLFDHRFDMPVALMEARDFHSADLTPYNTFIMVDGSYGNIRSGGIEKLKRRIGEGATLIAVKKAAKWAKDKGLAPVELRKQEDTQGRRSYEFFTEDLRSLEVKGVIVEAELDLAHPMGFGFRRSPVPVFRRGTTFIEPGRNPYASPLIYTGDPLLSGYIKKGNHDLLKNSAGIVVGGLGNGRVICMADNFNFRAYWHGTTKLFANAVFFGSVIDGKTVEKPLKK